MDSQPRLTIYPGAELSVRNPGWARVARNDPTARVVGSLGGMLVVLGRSGGLSLSLLHPETGERVEKIRVDDTMKYLDPHLVLIGKRGLFATDSRQIFGVDLERGKALWRRALRVDALHALVGLGGEAYAPSVVDSRTGHFTRLDRVDGNTGDLHAGFEVEGELRRVFVRDGAIVVHLEARRPDRPFGMHVSATWRPSSGAPPTLTTLPSAEPAMHRPRRFLPEAVAADRPSGVVRVAREKRLILPPPRDAEPLPTVADGANEELRAMEREIGAEVTALLRGVIARYYADPDIRWRLERLGLRMRWPGERYGEIDPALRPVAETVDSTLVCLYAHPERARRTQLPVVGVRAREVRYLADGFDAFFADFLADAADARPTAVDVLAEMLGVEPRPLDRGEAAAPEWFRRARGAW
jgi:hypothetical protein